jgi:hypothetical protein
MGAAARTFVHSEWSLQRYVERLAAFLEERREAWNLRRAACSAAGDAARRATEAGIERGSPAMRQLTDAVAAWAT